MSTIFDKSMSFEKPVGEVLEVIQFDEDDLIGKRWCDCLRLAKAEKMRLLFEPQVHYPPPKGYVWLAEGPDGKAVQVAARYDDSD